MTYENSDGIDNTVKTLDIIFSISYTVFYSQDKKKIRFVYSRERKYGPPST